ncbi:unnamed protein product [Danaus chrysippus]|uniref:(African queen) hypothetical protein n=1 Tax=Danaus chrysippus TaxID=151541 RepID=A0A8J2R7U3_9NEOP|nr:unnamed protein product [Danaus chrysippus]
MSNKRRTQTSSSIRRKKRDVNNITQLIETGNSWNQNLERKFYQPHSTITEDNEKKKLTCLTAFVARNAAVKSYFTLIITTRSISISTAHRNQRMETSRTSFVERRLKTALNTLLSPAILMVVAATLFYRIYTSNSSSPASVSPTKALKSKKNK